MSASPERLEVLTFRRGGALFAADLAQVAEMRDGTPKTLVLGGEGEPRLLAIDAPGEILTLPLDAIQPMPPLVAACAGAKACWGTVVLDGAPVLLVDLDEVDDLAPP